MPSLWNNLDIGLQLQHNKYTFSYALKEQLLSSTLNAEHNNHNN